MDKIVGIFAGGFKPPTKGHFGVIKEALKNNPQIDTFYVYIGKKDRDGISQNDSYKVWSLYSKYLPNKVEYIKTTVPPIKAVFDYSKENPNHQVLWVLGARQDNEDDFMDISSRTKTIDKYPNLTVETVILPSAVSGTAARNALKVSKEKFIPFLPDELNDKDIMQVYALLSNTLIQEGGDKNITKLASKYSLSEKEIINYLLKATKKELEYTDNMDLAMESAFNMLWKNINYYNNINETINLPQNIKFDRVEYYKEYFNNLVPLEMEVKREGDNIIISNISKNEETPYSLDIPKFNYERTLSENLWHTLNEISLSKENAVGINGDLTGGTFTVGNITYEYSIKNIPNPYKDLGLFYNIQFTPKGELTSIPQMGKENYIKILSTMYKIIVDFIDKKQPEYVGISSLDNNGKNYHKVYANLTDNKANNIPGYFRKDVNLEFNTPQGKGKFIVLKKKQNLNEEASYSNHIDYKQHIKDLTQSMIDQGMNIKPLPKVKFIHNNSSNAQNFLGRTAYYDPNNKEIVLYTEGRHPKDIVRSFAHEMIHHKQNLEGRLNDVNTTNTNEDGGLEDIEKEAYLDGNMTFRNWTDNIQENSSNVITEETLIEEEDRLMVEVVNPDGERFEYKKSDIKGLYTYKDSRDNLYFARISYNPLNTNSHFEFKTGWFKDNDITKPTYDPYLPPNTTGMDNLKRRNTIAKIYRDEILPFFMENKFISNKLYIKPISHSRHTFSKRLIKNHTSQDFNIEIKDDKIIISLPTKTNENKIKDPFGLKAYAMELGRLAEEEETQYQIYCDMDGVLVDFERGYKELTGIDPSSNDRPQNPKEFWEPLKQEGVKFWVKLNWMSDGKQLWDYIKPHKPKLLSAPSLEESSKIGKYLWVRNNTPGTKLILRSANRKSDFASKNNILIDDKESTIIDWREKGGIGILHTSAVDTINQLKKLGL